MNSARSVASPSRPWTRAGARALSLVGLALALAGCGQKGALYLPAPPAARPAPVAASPAAPSPSPAASAPAAPASR